MLDWAFDVIRLLDDIPVWVWLGMGAALALVYGVAKVF
jgi:hypothetical protein